jgi:hypothetical protein
VTPDRAWGNRLRHRAGAAGGHYESYFIRANHPSRPLGFWIRHTLVSPRGRPAEAQGEIWAVLFDGESGRHVAVKRECPLAGCQFEAARLDARIAGARLTPDLAVGRCERGGHEIAWDLRYGGPEPPLLLLARGFYERRLPRAKSVVPLPLARFDGALTVDGAPIEVGGWIGSQNHNWGSRHTDRYAWCQVAGFDGAPESFFEVASARYALGPCWTPWITPLVLRHAGRELRLNGLWRSLRTRAALRGFEWTFLASNAELRVRGRVSAAAGSFLGLRYANPPGGIKHCLNSKIATCRLTIEPRRAAASDGRTTLVSRHRAAFEVLADEAPPEVAIAC